MSQNRQLEEKEDAFRIKLKKYVCASIAFADDIEFLVDSDSRVKVDMYRNMSHHYTTQGESIKRDLRRCVTPIAEQKLKELEDQLENLVQGIEDLHRYMRFYHPRLNGNNGQQPDSPLSSGYESGNSSDVTPTSIRGRPRQSGNSDSDSQSPFSRDE